MSLLKLTLLSVLPPKRPTESRQKVVKRRRVINNNTDYEYDLGRIKQAKKTIRKSIEKSNEKDQSFYERISMILVFQNSVNFIHDD